MKILLISSGEKLQILLQYCQDLLPTFVIEGNVEFQLKVSENNVFQVFRPLEYDLTHDSLLVLNTVDWPLIISQPHISCLTPLAFCSPDTCLPLVLHILLTHRAFAHAVSSQIVHYIPSYLVNSPSHLRSSATFPRKKDLDPLYQVSFVIAPFVGSHCTKQRFRSGFICVIYQIKVCLSKQTLSFMNVLVCQDVITKFYCLSGLNNRSLCSHKSGGLKSKIEVSTRLVSSEVSFLDLQMASSFCVFMWSCSCACLCPNFLLS